MRLLFITQKINTNDDDLAFVILWIKEFIRQGVEVEVICLERGVFDDSFALYSLGKERGYGRLRRVLRFFSLIFSLSYDRVFVHMNPEYVTVGGWYWWLRRIPIYLWYTHYTMHVHLWLSGIFCARMFAATNQSLPQYEGNPKKIVTGHGIPTDYWLDGDSPQPVADTHKLLTVHRLSRSKRVEVVLHALALLPAEYSLTVYGRPVDAVYFAELEALVVSLGLTDRVTFAGPVPMDKLKDIYSNFRVMVNMASETIDKTMVESMLFGIYPVTTPRNSRAIGLPVYPQGETAEDIAAFIKERTWQSYDSAFLQNITRTKHSLISLIEKLLSYIIPGK